MLDLGNFDLGSLCQLAGTVEISETWQIDLLDGKSKQVNNEYRLVGSPPPSVKYFRQDLQIYESDQ